MFVSYAVFAAGLAVIALAIRPIREALSSGARAHGSASWLKLWEAGSAGLLGIRGVPLGDWGWAYLPVKFKGDGHILTVAPPGGGKSSTGSIPGGLSSGIRSRFVADPDGEITAVCIKRWRKKCDALFVINPFAMWTGAPWELPQHAFDPMTFVNPERDGSGKFARLMASALISSSGNEDGSTEYFKSQGGEKLEAYIIFGALHGLSLPQVADLMALPIESDSEGEEISSQLDLWKEMERIEILDGLLRKESLDLQDKLRNSPGEFQAIFSTMKDGVKFLKEPAIRRALSKNEVDWKALKDRKSAISVVMPVADWKLYGGFVKLAFMCVMLTLDEGEIAHDHVHILLEEFPALGRLAFFSELLATGRKKKAQIEVVIQNIGQVKSIYPEWQALVPNFEVRRFKAVRDGETARYVSNLLGRKTERLGNYHFGRELMTADEVMTMKKDRQIVFAGNLRPALLGQYPYWNKTDEKMEALKSPFYRGYPPVREWEVPRKLAGQFVALWERVTRPGPYMAILGISMLVWAMDPVVLIEEKRSKYSPAYECKWISWRGVLERKYNPTYWSASCGKLKMFDELWY